MFVKKMKGEDDFSYYTAVFDALREKHTLQAEYDPGSRSISITSPQGFAYREQFLPDEIVPRGEPYLFTTNREKVMNEIARCRKEEVAWPKCHLLWDMHPLLEWARDEIITLFGRHQAPVVGTPHISINEQIYLVSASYSNRKGQIAFHTCFGIYYQDTKTSGILELEEVMKRTGMARVAIPNTNTRASDYPELEDMLGEVVKKAMTEARKLRKEFVVKTDVKLKEQYHRLDGLRERKIRRLLDILDMNTHTLTKRKKEEYTREEQKIHRIFDEYIAWINDYMTISEDPFFTVLL